jgi:hypothetical protein
VFPVFGSVSSGEYVAETDDDVGVEIYEVVAPSTLLRIFVKAPGFLLPKCSPAPYGHVRSLYIRSVFVQRRLIHSYRLATLFV